MQLLKIPSLYYIVVDQLPGSLLEHFLRPHKFTFQLILMRKHLWRLTATVPSLRA